MANAAYSVPWSGTALVAATAKSMVYVKPVTNVTCTITAFAVTFDGVTASNTPVLIEVCTGTAVSNSTPGTGSTSTAGRQVRGTPGSSANAGSATAITSEPTVLTVVQSYLVPPTSGLIIQFPLGREIEVEAGTRKMVALRVTAPQVVNCAGYIEFEE